MQNRAEYVFVETILDETAARLKKSPSKWLAQKCVPASSLNKITTFSPTKVNDLSQPHATLWIKTDCVNLKLYEVHSGETDTGPEFFYPLPTPTRG